MLRLVNAALISMCFTSLGCGLYDDIPAQKVEAPSEEEPAHVDGDLCGPCELGTWKKGACDLGQLEGAVEVTAACEKVVFVDASADPAKSDGTKKAPYVALEHATDVGNAKNANVVLIAGADVHEGPIQLGDGLSVLGGFSRSWEQDAGLIPIIQAEAVGDSSDNWAVLAKGLRRPTVLKNVVLEATGNATTHYGLRLIDTQNLVLERVRIRTANGKAGAAGERGDDGAPGGRGKSAGVEETRAAGNGGVNAACPDANGGKGGRGGLNSASGTQYAEPGSSAALGTPGGEVGRNGGPGEAGVSGGTGDDGIEGIVKNGFWVLGMPGQTGDAGKPGHGGGGAGGGAVQGGEGSGGGGGGGGAGGCGGAGGEGGKNGGASIGMLVVDSQVVVSQSNIASGDGGNGGAGGEGGEGGEGGNFGFGADGKQMGDDGGRGGKGGNGGHGGKGGDGQGGVSYAILCAGNVEITSNETELRAGNGGLMGGESIVHAPSGMSKGCGF